MAVIRLFCDLVAWLLYDCGGLLGVGAVCCLRCLRIWVGGFLGW